MSSGSLLAALLLSSRGFEVIGRGFKMNKRGFELSASFIVTLILVIVIFIGSIYFVQKFFFKAEEMKTEIERSTQEQIESLLQAGSLVAIPINTKEIKAGGSGVFGLGVRNIGDTKGFRVVVSFNKAINELGEVLFDESYADYINDKWLLYDSSEFFLDSNKLKTIPIAVSPDYRVGESEDTVSGTYLFNVCVFVDTGVSSESDCSVDAFKYSPDKAKYYTKKMYSLMVNVK